MEDLRPGLSKVPFEWKFRRSPDSGYLIGEHSSWVYPYNILAFIEATRRPLYTGDMKSADPRVLAFIRLLREECRAAGVRIIFKNVRKLRDWDDRYRRTLDGYFVHPTKNQSGYIVVAAKVPTPQLLHTLAHEYVHFLQWRAKKPSFYTWSYVAHENLTEKSAIRLLEEHNLPINLRVRKQRSRAYIKKLKTGAL